MSTPKPAGVAGILLFILICALPASPCLGNDTVPGEALADSVQAGGNVFFPILGYTPDTSFLAGLTWLRFFSLDKAEKDSRPSLFSPVLVVTTKKQIMVVLGTELYWDQGKNHAVITPQYLRFPDKFFGIGRDSRADDEEDYTPEQFTVDLLYERTILKKLAVGLVYRFDKHRLVEVAPGGQLASGTIAGTENTTLSAPGLRLAHDSRDFTWSARRGSFIQAQVGFFRDGLGSDYNFTEYIVDLRKYWPLGTWGSLAVQAMGKAQEDAPPFFVLPRLGGFEGLRGYLSGRYQDQARVFGRVEWRSQEIWKGLGGALFAGWGDVSPDIKRLTTAAELYTIGLGLRYTINQEEQVKIRLDMGFGNGDSGFYLSLGEAF